MRSIEGEREQGFSISGQWVLSLTAALIFAGGTISPCPALAQNCVECHDGSRHDAPDVTLYWDGTWWEQAYGSAGLQQGGHGDPDRRTAMTCDGVLGCHNVNGAAAHRNGILETAGNPALNTAHLREEFLTQEGQYAWTVAETFNGACVEVCHQSFGVKLCAGGGHATDSPIPYVPRFGENNTPRDADGSSGARLSRYWFDSDVSTAAAAADPDYALCVSCHDPHGSGVENTAGNAVFDPLNSSNRMVRDLFKSGATLCNNCHGNPAPPPSTPIGLYASSGGHEDRILITWGDVQGETGYRLYRSSSEQGPFTIYRTTGANVTSFADLRVAGGEAWYYRVAANEEGLESSISRVERGYTAGYHPPNISLVPVYMLLLP